MSEQNTGDRFLDVALKSQADGGLHWLSQYLLMSRKQGSVYTAPGGDGVAVVAFVIGEDQVLLAGNYGEDIYPGAYVVTLAEAQRELRKFCAGWSCHWDVLDVTKGSKVRKPTKADLDHED